MRIWAISDLHLGFSTGKWMDVFGEHWHEHHVRVEAAWRERIAAGDLVLMPGDFSWAMKLEQVRVDFEWLSALPGTKVLIKGNHDYWWAKSKKKMREALPDDVHWLKKSALVVHGVPIVGVRGCDLVPLHGSTQDEVDLHVSRELAELELSIEHLGTLGPLERPPIALFHYPPFALGECESPFTRLVEKAACRHALYGHLHAREEWEQTFQGERNGVHYRLVSCDALDFTPILVEEVG